MRAGALKALAAATLMLGLAACASAPKKPASVAGKPDAQSKPVEGGKKRSPYAPAQEDPGTRGDYTAGGLYKPGVADSTPDYIPDVDAIPEPEIIAEPRSRAGNRSSYTVLGKQYRVLDTAKGYVEQGNASYYGKKFHGRRTSNLEVYDMYAFTAAHKSLPLPSFARVTNLDNGKSVTVRVNDRGPFHPGRIIDLSYAAAVKLGITQRGTGRVEVRALDAGEARAPSYASAANNPPPAMGAVRTTPGSTSTLDKLVAAIPVASASAGELPPGVRIATGKPARLNPSANPAQPVATPATPAPTDYRFDMRQDGKAMTAAEFDAWMKARQVRVATGKPGRLDPSSAATPPAAVALAPAVPIATPATHGLGVTLQVASFAARGNADRALAMLRSAGIDDAQLHDGNANGQQVWRLRVGPLDAGSETRLAARIVGLGFGPPQRVRD